MYILDTVYTWGFYSSQSPVLMNYVARVNGLAVPPVEQPFTNLELGCGNGMTSNILADALPQGEFYAVDLNAEHIANARRLAEQGKLSNMTFIESSFEALLLEDLPAFDYISLHGVYAWVSPEVRRDIVRLVDKFLKPDGLVYVSYNTMPGWAALMPLRQIMLSYTAGMEMPSLEKAARGRKYLKLLRDKKAAYFEQNPDAGKALDKLLEKDLRYISHEYFNEFWHPLYFSEVAEEMDRVGLSYCGTTEVPWNYTELILPRQFHSLIESASTLTIRETHKSLILNEKFRKDVYSKNPDRLSVSARQSLFSNSVFGANCVARDIRKKVQVGERSLGYSGDLFNRLIRAATPGLQTVAEIRALPTMHEFPGDDVTFAIKKLVVGGQFQIFATKARKVGAKRPARFRIVSSLNRAILNERLLEDASCVLASPVLGNGISIKLIPGLLLLGSDAVGLAGAVDHACDALKSSGKNWRRKSKAVKGSAERRAVIEAELSEFRRKWIPLLLRFGVIEPVKGSVKSTRK